MGIKPMRGWHTSSASLHQASTLTEGGGARECVCPTTATLLHKMVQAGAKGRQLAECMALPAPQGRCIMYRGSSKGRRTVGLHYPQAGAWKVGRAPPDMEKQAVRRRRRGVMYSAMGHCYEYGLTLLIDAGAPGRSTAASWLASGGGSGWSVNLGFH